MLDMGGGRAGGDTGDMALRVSNITADTAPTPRRALPAPHRCAISSGVSLRPRSGSRYPNNPVPNDHWWQDFGRVPGGRRLWCRLVVVFTLVSLFGVGFIFLGAAFVQQAYQIFKERHLSLPLTWCIIGMVSGTLMVLAGFILGRFIISDKWRKNEQSTYPPMTPRPPTRVQCTTNNNDPELEADVQIELPPPYDPSDLPSIFIVTRRNIAVTLPAPSVGLPTPPSYTDTVGSPPKYTEIDDVAHQQNEEPHEATTPSQNAATSRMITATRPYPSNVRGSRIEVITVVSTREDPPPYDAHSSSHVMPLGGSVTPPGSDS